MKWLIINIPTSASFAIEPMTSSRMRTRNARAGTMP